MPKDWTAMLEGMTTDERNIARLTLIEVNALQCAMDGNRLEFKAGSVLLGELDAVEGRVMPAEEAFRRLRERLTPSKHRTSGE